MITRIQALLLAGILGLAALVFAGSHASAVTAPTVVKPTDSLAWVDHADVSDLLLKHATLSSDGSTTVIESAQAADCSAGGWKFIVSGYPVGRCCGQTRRYVRYVGGKDYYKCCGACPQ